MKPPLPANLRQRLREVDLTQEALARRIDVSTRTVTSWTMGQSLPRWPQLVRIAEALDREPAWFYTERDDAPSAPVEAA
jgi:transcriptional regulator with XRE-family HTH domain